MYKIVPQFNTPTNFFLFLPSLDSIPIIPFDNISGYMIRANGACYIPKIGVYNHRTITEGSRGMVISPISVDGVAENRIMHDNELSLSTCVWNDSTKFAQNVSEDNSRVHVCVYVRARRYRVNMGLSCVIVI